jgi:hypothetical protein
MSLKVIGAGLPRTGTLSMKVALEQLGFDRCYHMEEVFREPARSDAWARHFSGEPVDWDEVFEGYGAAVDAPACFAWQALVQRYPDAKVVLTVRDADTWFESMSKTILSEGYIDRLMVSSIGPMLGPMMNVMMSIAGGPPPASPPPPGPPPREALIAMREAHNAAVIKAIPPERLLVFKVSEGWAPLCRFLGVQVPDTPFPRVNDAESFHASFSGPASA